MSKLEKISKCMERWPQLRAQGAYIVVPTYGLYQSGAIIEVFIEVGEQRAQISDGGGAYKELCRAGDFEFDAMRVLKHFGKRVGFSVDDRGWILISDVDLHLVSSYVAMIADASKEASSTLLKNFKPILEYDFKKFVQRHLHEVFGSGVKQDVRVMGADKKHRFDYGVKLSNGQQLLMDLVVTDANSINSAVVSHLDVKRLDESSIIQRIVYNEELDWKSGDLSLLTMGATTIQSKEIPNFINGLRV